jgi:hypothetical protein
MTSNFVSLKRTVPAAPTDEPGISAESALDAIRTGRSEGLEALLQRLNDHQAFFSSHYDAITDAICESGSGDVLFVLLTLGFPMKSDFMERAYRKGNLEILKVIEERMDKGKSRDRWEREAKYYKNKYRFKIVSR